MLPRKTRVDRSSPIRVGAANLLQDAILRGDFRPGEEIPQTKLSQNMGLSQSSVREALQELETRGLIVKQGRTWTVTELSQDDLADLYQVRAALEPLACRLAAYQWREELTDELEDCLERMRQAALAKDYLQHSRADMDFHQSIWRWQPNRYLEKHLDRLCMKLFAYDLVERSGCAYLDFERSLRQHRTIISALRTRDGARAEKVVRRLIERFHRQDVVDFHSIEEGVSPQAPEGR